MPNEPNTGEGTHLLQRRDRWGNRWAFWVLVAVAFSLPFMGASLKNLRMDNDVDQWLPSDDPQMQILEWFGQEFGHEDYVLVSWDGCNLEDGRITRFEELITPPPGDEPVAAKTGIVKVMTPHGLLDEMRRNGIRPDTALNELRGVLVSHDPSNLAAVSLQIDARQTSARQILERIRDAAERAGVPRSTLHLGGTIVARDELDRSVNTASWNPQAPWWQPWRRSPAGVSVVMVMGLTLLLLRSLRLTVMVLSISLFTAVATLALIPLCGSSMNMVLVVLPTLLMVLTLAGAIHMVNYWQHAAVENRLSAIRQSIRMAAQPCTLAVVTTAIGMLSLLTSDLRPVRDFGLFSAMGVVLSLGTVLLGVPCLLTLWPPKKVEVSEATTRFWSDLGRWLARHRRAVGYTWVLGTLAASAGLMHFQTETKVIRFFQPDTPLVKDYRFLEQNLAGINPINVVVSFDAEAQGRLDVLQRMEMVRRVEQVLLQHPEVSGTLSLAAFRPPLDQPPATAPFMAKARYQRTLHDMKAHIDDNFSNSRTLAQSVDYPIDVDFGSQQVSLRNGDEVWRVKASVKALTDANYAPLIAELESRTSDVIAGERGVTRVVTGMVPLFLRTQEALRDSLIESFELDYVLIGLVLTVLLRGVKPALVAILPTFFPVTLVFGLIAWYGMAVDIGSMVTASVALGIGVDATIHLHAWFEKGLRQGLSREEAIAQSMAHCGPAMWQTSAIICLGLLGLMGADLLLVSRFGWLMAAMVFVATFSDLIFLPTLMAGSLGKLMENRVRAEQATSAAGEAATDPFPSAVPLMVAAAEVEIPRPHILTTQRRRNVL